MRHAHSFKKLLPEDLHTQLVDGKGHTLLIIDTLPNDHFSKVHLPGSKNACVFEMNFLDQVKALAVEISKPIVVYGASNNSLDSRTAAEKLSMAGYSDVSVLDGGIERWRQSNYPLEGTNTEHGSNEDPERLLTDGKYAILPEECRIGWTGRNANSSHFGTVNVSGGTIVLRESSMQGSLTIDMDSIENINLAGNELQQVLISHLKSDDFFFIDAFPAARLDIRGGRFTHQAFPTQPNCEITSTLDMRGLQNDLTFQATVVKGMDNHLHLSAHFDMDRTLWGISYGSSRFFEHLGMHAVFDDISIELLVVAKQNG